MALRPTISDVLPLAGPTLALTRAPRLDERGKAGLGLASSEAYDARPVTFARPSIRVAGLPMRLDVRSGARECRHVPRHPIRLGVARDGKLLSLRHEAWKVRSRPSTYNVSGTQYHATGQRIAACLESRSKPDEWISVAPDWKFM